MSLGALGPDAPGHHPAARGDAMKRDLRWCLKKYDFITYSIQKWKVWAREQLVT